MLERNLGCSSKSWQIFNVFELTPIPMLTKAISYQKHYIQPRLIVGVLVKVYVLRCVFC